MKLREREEEANMESRASRRRKREIIIGMRIIIRRRRDDRTGQDRTRKAPGPGYTRERSLPAARSR
jgi:hypothetical protein